MNDRTCTAPYCAKDAKNRGKYCSMHSARMYRRGSLDLPESYQGKPVSLNESFWSKTRKTPGCWIWQGSKNDSGYGQIRRSKKIIYVHRLSYEMHSGLIPENHYIDHICRNPGCVNPEHLRLATPLQNSENRSNISRITASGYRGVVIAPNGKFRAQVNRGKKLHSAGFFDDVEDALEAVVNLRLKLHTHNVDDRILKKV